MGQPRKRGTRLRVCADCGKSEQVRQDNDGLHLRARQAMTRSVLSHVAHAA